MVSSSTISCHPTTTRGPWNTSPPGPIAGRSVEDLDRPQLVVCSVHEDRATALDMARLMVTQYLGQQPHIMKASGVPQSLLDAVGGC